MSRGKELVKGYVCSQCKKQHDYPPYVYAHWDEVLHHQCECGAMHEILYGNAVREHPKVNGSARHG